MTTIERTIDIAATPETIWQVLTDLDGYAAWNPFLVAASGTVAVGETLTVTFKAGKRTMTLKPTLKVVEPARRLAWLGRLVLPRIFDGAHEFVIEPLGASRSRLVQRETFRGLLVPLFGRLLADTALGFEAMNAAVRDRAEASQGAAATPGPSPTTQAA